MGFSGGNGPDQFGRVSPSKAVEQEETEAALVPLGEELGVDVQKPENFFEPTFQIMLDKI